MNRSRGLTVAVLVVSGVVSLLAVAAQAPASSKQRHVYTGTVRVVQFSTNGAIITNVGFEDSSLGHALVSSVDTVKGRVQGTTTVRFTEVSRHYYGSGSFTADATGTATSHPDGTLTSPPMVETIVSGTGRFRGAVGKWTLTGTARRPGQTHFTYHLKGTITY